MYQRNISQKTGIPVLPQWGDKRIVLPESFKRIVIQTLFRSHERDIVNINYSPMKNSSCLEIKVDLKMCEKLSFLKSRLI